MKTLVLVGLLFLAGCSTHYRDGYFYVKSTPTGYAVALDAKDSDGGSVTVFVWSGLRLQDATRDAKILNMHLSNPTAPCLCQETE